jgi:hypothetical protein
MNNDITGYKVTYSHTSQVDRFDSYDDAVAAVRSVFGEDAEIGHDGDIDSGGEHTLVWRDASQTDDDGCRAVASIWVQHATEVRP